MSFANMNLDKLKEFEYELKHHLPFSLIASLVAIAIVIIFSMSIMSADIHGVFEIMHPAHVLVSAIATASIYHKYKKSMILSIGIGSIGAILIGTISDIIFPWILGNVFSLQTSLHLPIFEETFLILGVAIIGGGIGSLWNLSKPTHSLHVLLSVFASLAYILSFSINMNVITIILTSAIVFLSVYVPCCVSDIIFPLLFIKKKCKKCGHFH